MELISTEENNLTDTEIMSAFNNFFIDDGYSFCLSDSRLKSIHTDHIETPPALNWCQLKFSNCKSKTYELDVAPQSTKKFISELNKFNFKTLKEICRELNVEEHGGKSTLKKRLILLRIEHILAGKPIMTMYKV